MASKDKNQTYDAIERPYGPFLERESSSSIPVGGGESFGDGSSDGAGTTAAGGGGEVGETQVKSEQSVDNLWIDNWIKSKNWQPKKFGFYIDGKTGYAEFSNIYISGAITVITGGTIGGWTISPTELSSGSVKLQSTAERILMGAATAPLVGTGIFLGKDAADYELRVGNPASNYLHWDGSTLTMTGGIVTNTSISSIPNSTATDISLLEATHDLVFSVTDKDTVTWAAGTITLSNGRTFSILTGNTGNMAARTYIYLDTGTSSTVLQTTTTVSTAMGANKKLIAVAENGSAQAQYTVYGGIGGIKLPASGTSISNNNWTYSGTWTVTDADTITWGSGTLSTSDGGAYSVTGSNTGNMAAKTYVYFDLGVSATAFQTTTTAATAIGDGKILIAICQNATAEAKFIVVNDNSYNIDAANIVAGSITANEISSGAVTAVKINVSQLSAIAADLGAITAGTIVLPSGGFIRSGQTAYNTGTGWYIGNDSGITKFSIGNGTTQSLTWDGTTLTVTGALNVSSINIPDTTTAASFHVKSDGDTWWGANVASGLAGANASVTKTGDATFKSIQIGGTTRQYTIGDDGVFNFGDGSDGSATISVNTTLSEDKNYTDLTINTGVTLITAGYILRCKGTLTLSGTAKISWNGNNGSNGGNGTTGDPIAHTGGVGGGGGAGGTALATTRLKGSVAGGDGGVGGSGPYGDGIPANGGAAPAVSGTAVSNSLGTDGSNGGTGGAGGGATGATGGAGGVSTGGVATVRSIKLTVGWHLQCLLDINTDGTTAKYNTSAGGGGGGGGGGSGVQAGNSGGGGGGGGGAGSGGGFIAIFAKNIVIGASASILATGGNGANGGNGAIGAAANAGGAGGGSGGAGGDGGIIVYAYNTLSNLGTIAVAGGSAGTGGTGAAGTGTGVAGSNGVSGTAGGVGTIFAFQLSL